MSAGHAARWCRVQHLRGARFEQHAWQLVSSGCEALAQAYIRPPLFRISAKYRFTHDYGYARFKALETGSLACQHRRLLSLILSSVGAEEWGFKHMYNASCCTNVPASYKCTASVSEEAEDDDQYTQVSQLLLTRNFVAVAAERLYFRAACASCRRLKQAWRAGGLTNCD
jgi:hypothetical protein